MSGRKQPLGGQPDGLVKPTPTPAPPRVRRWGQTPGTEMPGEVTTDTIVDMLGKVELTADQSERICVVAASRAKHARTRIVRADHVMAMLEGAHLSRDEAKLIGIRALRRANALEEEGRARR